MKLKFNFTFFSDLNYRELAIVTPLLILVFFLGIAPGCILHFYDVSYITFFLFMTFELPDLDVVKNIIFNSLSLFYLSLSSIFIV